MERRRESGEIPFYVLHVICSDYLSRKVTLPEDKVS